MSANLSRWSLALAFLLFMLVRLDYLVDAFEDFGVNPEAFTAINRGPKRQEYVEVERAFDMESDIDQVAEFGKLAQWLDRGQRHIVSMKYRRFPDRLRACGGPNPASDSLPQHDFFTCLQNALHETRELLEADSKLARNPYSLSIGEVQLKILKVLNFFAKYNLQPKEMISFFEQQYTQEIITDRILDQLQEFYAVNPRGRTLEHSFTLTEDVEPFAHVLRYLPANQSQRILHQTLGNPQSLKFFLRSFGPHGSSFGSRALPLAETVPSRLLSFPSASLDDLMRGVEGEARELSKRLLEFVTDPSKLSCLSQTKYLPIHQILDYLIRAEGSNFVNNLSSYMGDLEKKKIAIYQQLLETTHQLNGSWMQKPVEDIESIKKYEAKEIVRPTEDIYLQIWRANATKDLKTVIPQKDLETWFQTEHSRYQKWLEQANFVDNSLHYIQQDHDQISAMVSDWINTAPVKDMLKNFHEAIENSQSRFFWIEGCVRNYPTQTSSFPHQAV